jgi:hypothetical protein
MNDNPLDGGIAVFQCQAIRQKTVAASQNAPSGRIARADLSRRLNSLQYQFTRASGVRK